MFLMAKFIEVKLTRPPTKCSLMANPYLAKNLRPSAQFLETRYIRYASLKIDSILLNHMRLQFIPLPPIL